MTLRIARRLLIGFLLSLASAAPALAQPRAEWYALGVLGQGIMVNAGGEAVIDDRVGIGGEGGLGVLAIPGSFTLSSGFSVRVPTHSTTRPLLTAGVSYHEWYLGSFRGFYFGAGLDDRLSRTRGARYEVRYHVGRGHYSSDRIVTLRAGVTFR